MGARVWTRLGDAFRDNIDQHTIGRNARGLTSVRRSESRAAFFFSSVFFFSSFPFSALSRRYDPVVVSSSSSSLATTTAVTFV